uniref:Activator of Hsp90 ATPase AHSA1-like N-terminal domain-containing protein n=1 Tax=Alexandrium catenella TaxID=2925 RepID=A0A7S1SC34_ALECA
MKRREPVQLRELQMVRDLEDGDEAKAKGNELFKAGDLSAALAHYEKGVQLLRQQEQVPVVAVATLLSNAALCHLKLKWPDRAKKNASMAIAAVRQAEDGAFDQSKLFYRRALACEQLKDFGTAVDDMARALQQAKKTGLPLAEQHRLKAEVERLKKLRASAEESAEKRRREQENERTAEVQRLQGEKLEASKKSEASSVPIALNSDYLQEQDFSHWAKRQVQEAVKGVTHACASGGHIEVIELDESKSKIQAAITTKKGTRALYYEMDVHCTWKGKAAKGLASGDGPHEMQGLIRVYNIAHDTKFQLGGDENTSYMYQLGWDHRKTGPWVEDLRTEAAELFDKISERVDGVVRELRKK